MSWWKYGLSILAAMAICAAAVPFFYYFPRLVAIGLWRIIPNGRAKRWLFSEGGEPLPGKMPPWVTERIIKTPLRTNRIAAPPEFIARSEFEERNRD